MSDKTKTFQPIVISKKAEVEQPPSDSEAESELLDIVGGIGHDDIPFTLDWSDEDESPAFKQYLLDTYGEEIKQHESFLLKCY